MLRFVLISALISCALAQMGGDYGGYGMSGGDESYGGGESYGGESYGGDYGHKEQKVTYITKVHKTPIYKTFQIPYTYKSHETHHSQPVKEHNFEYNEYRTPGKTYAIPAMKTIKMTKPGYTTYKTDYITKSHVTHHQVPGKTISTPIIKTFVEHKKVPVHYEKQSYHGDEQQSYQHGGYDGNEGGYQSGGY